MHIHNSKRFSYFINKFKIAILIIVMILSMVIIDGGCGSASVKETGEITVTLLPTIKPTAVPSLTQEELLTAIPTQEPATVTIDPTSVITIVPEEENAYSYITSQEVNSSCSYTFKSENLLQDHFSKHGSEFGYTSASQYERGASAVINSPVALHKTEVEDGDSVFYIEATNELVILSTEGYIRTYFKPEDGIDYYNKQ